MSAESPVVDIPGGSFVVATSGFADGPAQPLVRYLNEHGASQVTAVAHPLVSEGPAEHRIQYFVDGQLDNERRCRRPNLPPFTFALDPISPVFLPRSDAWFGFNCLVTAQGLARRRLHRTRRVVHWNVDFVPNRFGPNSAMTKTYEWLDRLCCVRADGRVELSEAARRGRSELYGFESAGCPVEVIPMGTWQNETPKTSVDNFDSPRLVFLGHLVERMGLDTLIDALHLLTQRGRVVPCDIIGGGPLLEDVRARCVAAGLAESVTVHGFVAEFADVEQILSRAAVALAPYEPSADTFSRYADPGKLKAYLGAGLPIILTDVPPNAADLRLRGGGSIVEATPQAFADEIERVLDDREQWRQRHRSALDYARLFDWETLFETSLPALGIRL